MARVHQEDGGPWDQNMSVKEYKVVSAKDPESLAMVVNMVMRLPGWEPIGGVSVVQTNWYSYRHNTYDEWTYYQSMVRRA